MIPIFRRPRLPAIWTKLHPGAGWTAIAGTAGTPIPTETIARTVANWPLSNITFGRKRALAACGDRAVPETMASLQQQERFALEIGQSDRFLMGARVFRRQHCEHRLLKKLDAQHFIPGDGKGRFQVVLETPEGLRSIECDEDDRIWDAAARAGIGLPAICH